MPDTGGTFYYDDQAPSQKEKEMELIQKACDVQAAKHFADRFGLVPTGVSLDDIDHRATFAVGESICVSWIFRGQTRPGGDSFGWDFKDEVRQVAVRVLSRGYASVKGDELLACNLVEAPDGRAAAFDIRYDSLAVLGQLGVQAVGRPLAPPAMQERAVQAS